MKFRLVKRGKISIGKVVPVVRRKCIHCGQSGRREIKGCAVIAAKGLWGITINRAGRGIIQDIRFFLRRFNFNAVKHGIFEIEGAKV